MRPETKEWSDKAEADYGTAAREAAVVDFPNHDAVCFHAQQCVEKYLKALLVEGDARFPKTHDLLLLLNLAVPAWPDAESFRDDLANLTPYAVDVRYPGDRADAELAEEALKSCQRVRAALRSLLALTP